MIRHQVRDQGRQADEIDGAADVEFHLESEDDSEDNADEEAEYEADETVGVQ